MADLSQLSDEQLQVYKDLLISKSNPSNLIPKAKPPTPAGLVGPPPGRLETAVNNLPGSLLNAVRHPSFPGMPIDAPQGEEELGPTPEKIGRELSSFGHSITHPEEDPAGTLLTLAGMGRGIAKRGTGGMSVSNPVSKEVGMTSPESVVEVAGGAARGAGKGATSMVDISRYGHKLSVPAPVAGAAMGGLAAWPFEHIPVVGKYVPPIAAGLGAGAPVVKGAYGGAREAMDRIASRGQEPRPPGPSIPPQPEGQAPGPIGPLGKPTLPSGRKVGAMWPETPQAAPVSAPGGVGGGNAPAVPSAPDVQVTQAAEFATPESKVPPVKPMEPSSPIPIPGQPNSRSPLPIKPLSGIPAPQQPDPTIEPQPELTTIGAHGAVIKALGSGVKENARTLYKTQISKGDPTTFKNPAAIALARAESDLILRDNPDGSVSVIGVKESSTPQTKQLPQGVGPVNDPTKPISIPHFNKFSQTGGPYKVVSKGGATLGTYDTLADAQKGMSDSNFASKQLKVIGPEESSVKSSTQPQIEGQVQDPRLSRGSIQKHLEGISRKTENVKAFVSDPANQVTVEELESLKNDLTQAEDPAKYHSAIQKAKTMGKEVYVHAKGKGAPIPDSPYKTFSLDDIDTAIKALQLQK